MRVHCRSRLTEEGIIPNRESRKERIWEIIVEAAKSKGGIIPEESKKDLLEEVTDLVEAPTLILGTFDPSFLDLPE